MTSASRRAPAKVNLPWDVYQTSNHIKPQKELLGLLGASEIHRSFPTKVATLRLHRVDQHPSLFPGLRGVVCVMMEIWGSLFTHTSSTTQGSGGSFKNGTPIGEVGCWSKIVGMSNYPSIYLSIDRSIDLSIYRSIDLSVYRSIDLSIY